MTADGRYAVGAKALAWMQRYGGDQFALDAEQERLIHGIYGVSRARLQWGLRTGPGLYYGPDGRPGEREYLARDIAERRVARTGGLRYRGRPAVVSTVLLPCAWVVAGPRKDLPFQSAVLVENHDTGRAGDQDEELLIEARYPTRARAEAGHAALVDLLRATHRAKVRRIRSGYARRRRRR